MDALFEVPVPRNEPVYQYAPGSKERHSLVTRLGELASHKHELPMTIGGRRYDSGGDELSVVQPHNHGHVLGTTRNATDADVSKAVSAAKEAAPAWRDMSFHERAAIFLRAADLLAGPWRDTINAATMLGQSKTIQQAEIDAACELIDFLRFNVHFAEQLLAKQPNSVPGTWNTMDHRPLEGFVVAITPFNFTAIAGNLPSAPALMGNTVVWKPTVTQQLAAHYTMKLFEAAGLPPGVINMVTGDGTAVSKVALSDPDFAGLHFTGSTGTFQHLWKMVGDNLSNYRTYPRIVGETGGKDFIIAHSSAEADPLHTALVRGAFEYQGQKCSAASRAYIPNSIWNDGLRDRFVATTETLKFGDVSDLSNFAGAVIDRRAFDKHAALFERIKGDDSCTILTGGTVDDSVGYFVAPTIVECSDPNHELFRDEYFGPIIAVHPFEDSKFTDVVTQAADASPYALTGAVWGIDRQAVNEASKALRFSAGNFYINDKPTGSVVSQQPFGGGRASGTNDKAGSWQNLARWISPRVIKETFVPPVEHGYPHMES
ncbi:MAG TPA: L-glutamate gamma-semialdehyde dehydrogenase [Candidatus Stackebrandtia faecavium]|nr:L-glutamate gamma-semialdehyde dehydrogenase [Candidatus Stackebrandtia faecavium]